MTAAVLGEDMASVREAHEDLDRILEAITQEQGVRAALDAAAAVVTAIDAGQLDGRHYRARKSTGPDRWGDAYEGHGACVIGTMATRVGHNERGSYVELPGYDPNIVGPIEAFVMEERTGSTAHTSRVLATVHAWCTAWMRQRS